MKTTIPKLTAIGVSAMVNILLSIASPGIAQQNSAFKDAEKPTIILVHGAFADGSSWNKVIPILQKKGY